jgi:hypothetical protein
MHGRNARGGREGTLNGLDEARMVVPATAAHGVRVGHGNAEKEEEEAAYSMTDQAKARSRPRRRHWRQSSLREEPVVAQLNCGYCVNATARSTPSRRIASRHSSVSGLAYLNAT